MIALKSESISRSGTVLIAGIGVYELRNHKTKLSKVLAVGLIAFHVDGAIADLTDATPLSRQILEFVAGAESPRRRRRNG